ncbi:MAG: hypothetical protein RSD27_03545, partial [Ruthenibacterium sp.]
EKNFYDLTVDTDSQITKAKEVVAGSIVRQMPGDTPPAASTAVNSADTTSAVTADASSVPAA